MLNKSEFQNHLTNDLLPFWNNLYDKEYGGFYGRVDKDNNFDKKSSKSAVLQARVLWYYSSCYKVLQEEKLLEFANLQFDFLTKHMIDPADGGMYWSVEYDGKIKNSQKHTYAQAFALYAISAYYSVTKNGPALILSDKLFNLIENNFKDDYGYIEPYDMDYPALEKTRTMNTLLHIIEAYAEYCQAVKSKEIKNALEYALNLVTNKAYNDKLSRIDCYFDEFMKPISDMLSYGHDIEASWLIYRACEVLGNGEITKNLAPKLEKVAQNVISKGFINDGKDGLYYDCKDGVENKVRSWWVMSEAIVALVHQYKLYGDNKSMLLAENIWDYVKKYFISPYGEWYSHINDKKELNQSAKNSTELVGPWKCPYHNGRMCLEMMNMLT
jgi:mannobiose 2-epimerase